MSGKMSSALPEIKISDARLTRLYQYWIEKKGNRLAPSRTDIAPEDIPKILPWVFIMERVGDRLRYRLAGSAFTQMYGGSLTGRFLDEIDLDHITASYIGQYEQSAKTMTPVASTWRFTKLDGRYLDYERLILPLSQDGRSANMFLCGAVGFGHG
jgi:hypothetical protein